MECLVHLGRVVSRFYLHLWIRWAIRLTLCSVTLALVLSFLVTSVIYVFQGSQSMTTEVQLAIFEVFKFWFLILWGVSLLVALFRSIKYIFNICYAGHKLTLLSCLKEKNIEVLENIGYGDLVKVWRKWFMLIIWLVSIQMIIALFITYSFTDYEAIFEWFNIYVLYGFILVAGYFSFIILSKRCKRVRISKC